MIELLVAYIHFWFIAVIVAAIIVAIISFGGDK